MVKVTTFVVFLVLLFQSVISFGAGRAIQYMPPTIPMMLNSEMERREYMAQNYWRNFDFTDSSTIESRVAEDAFVRYITFVLGGSPLDMAQKSVVDMMEKASVDSLVFDNFALLAERYLYDPNSNYRNDELYIPILEYIIHFSKVDKWEKVRYEYQLKMALKNRVGTEATDFTITLADGKQQRLSQIDSRFTILLFNNPDCYDCIRVKEFIVSNNEIFSSANIVSIYIDSDLDLWRKTSYPDGWINGYDKGEVITKEELYDLKAIPTIYLLDRDRQIILKDATVEVVAQYLASLR